MWMWEAVPIYLSETNSHKFTNIWELCYVSRKFFPTINDSITCKCVRNECISKCAFIQQQSQIHLRRQQTCLDNALKRQFSLCWQKYHLLGGKLEHSSKSGRRLRSSYCKIDYGIFSNNHTCYLLRKGRSNRGGPSKERELYERANMRKIKKKTTLKSLN